MLQVGSIKLRFGLLRGTSRAEPGFFAAGKKRRFCRLRLRFFFCYAALP